MPTKQYIKKIVPILIINESRMDCFRRKKLIQKTPKKGITNCLRIPLIIFFSFKATYLFRYSFRVVAPVYPLTDTKGGILLPALSA